MYYCLSCLSQSNLRAKYWHKKVELRIVMYGNVLLYTVVLWGSLTYVCMRVFGAITCTLPPSCIQSRLSGAALSSDHSLVLEAVFWELALCSVWAS